MATTAKRTKASASRRPVEPKPKPKPKSEPKSEPAAPVCTVAFCPLCLAVTAVQPLKPEAIEHLLLAGREFLLAAKSILDARTGDAVERDRSTLEKIDIE